MANTTLEMAPMQWAGMKDIDDVEPLNDGDSECLAEIREVLKKHGKRDRFGVALLHKHFDLAGDEVLVEYTDKESRVLTIKAVKAASNRSPHFGAGKCEKHTGFQGLILSQICFRGNFRPRFMNI